MPRGRVFLEPFQYSPSIDIRKVDIQGDHIRLVLASHCESGSAQRRAIVAETAEMLGLTAYLAEEAGNLPHGLQRLVSIGIAFAARPKLLCLDEPLTGLNQTEVANTLAFLERIRDEFGCSVLLVEHNMKAVMRVCDRIVVLHHGQHLATGTPSEIRADQKVIEAYLGHRHEH